MGLERIRAEKLAMVLAAVPEGGSTKREVARALNTSNAYARTYLMQLVDEGELVAERKAWRDGSAFAWVYRRAR